MNNRTSLHGIEHMINIIFYQQKHVIGKKLRIRFLDNGVISWTPTWIPHTLVTLVKWIGFYVDGEEDLAFVLQCFRNWYNKNTKGLFLNEYIHI